MINFPSSPTIGLRLSRTRSMDKSTVGTKPQAHGH